MHQHRTLGDTVYFGFGANTTAGTAGDGTSPTFAVRKAGAASSAAPTLTGTATLLSHASYSDGSYEVAVAATVGNGFETGATYLVFCSLSISGVNPNGFLGTFDLSPIRANDSSGNAIPTAAQNAAATRDVSNASPAAGSLGEAVNAIPASVVAAIEGGSVTVVTEGPVLTADGPLEIVSGDDYQNATADRRISVTLNGTGYGSLTGDDWTLRLNTRGADAVSVAGAAEMLTADSLRVKFPVTAAQSGGLLATQGEWSVRRAPATQSVAFDVVRGPLIVSRDLSVKRT